MMEKFVEKLKSIEVEPRGSSWLKLENRLQDDRFYAKTKNNNYLRYGLIVASVTFLIVSSVFLFRFSINQNSTLDSFVIENIDDNMDNSNSIYDINQLKSLQVSYVSTSKEQGQIN